MRFIDHLQSNDISSEKAAEELSTEKQPVSESAVRKWMYRERTPRKAMIQRIHEWSEGAVTAADWFETPSPDAGAKQEATAS